MSKLTHEAAEQMSLFEDPKMDFYREWDRQYDAKHTREGRMSREEFDKSLKR